MDNDVDAVVLACLGTLVDWSGGIEAVAYESARVNGESPMDRGVALRRRVEHLSRATPGRPCLATGFERLAAERGWRRGATGDACRRRVIDLTRTFDDAAPALELAARAGLPLIVLSHADRVLAEGALRPLDGAFQALVTPTGVGGPGAPDALLGGVAECLGTAPARLLHVSASRSAITAANAIGMRRAWLNRVAARTRPVDLPASEEWSTLAALPEHLGVRQDPLTVAG